MSRFSARALARGSFAFVLASVLGGCASAQRPIVLPAHDEPSAARAADAPTGPTSEPGSLADRGGSWIGAAGESQFLLAGPNDTSLGVWVDVPSALAKMHAPTAVSLVVDTSGSMAGAKIENARLAARQLVERLADGDLVDVVTFSDEARELVAPTVLSKTTRPVVLKAIEGLRPQGGTNMFDGLRLAEDRVRMAPATFPVRRVLLVSDGQANVGPSSPEVLGALAARGAQTGVQVTSIGVGLDYDENTLNALAMRSSGRLYHLGEPKEMTAILDGEMKLLAETAATNAFVEIVPAAGVTIAGVDGASAQPSGNGWRVPLGTMFGGQHREMLVRVRVDAPREGQHAIASVRLHFSDPTDSNLERVQEIVARYEVTTDRVAIEDHANGRTRAIAAMQTAAQSAIAAAQQVNTGKFEDADRELARQEAKLRDVAEKAKDDDSKRRTLAAVDVVRKARSVAKEAAAAPAPARPTAARASALDMNAAGMKASGL